MRSGFLIFLLAAAAYASSLGNGFAWDDEGILGQNPTVTSGDWVGALGHSWWPSATAGAGLYRPLTSASFAAEWGLFGAKPLPFHVGNVIAHAVVAVLVFILLASLVAPPGAMVGAALFAIHPVHTEAVANVVGRAELYAAAFYLGACILFWRGRSWQGVRSQLRLIGLGVLYLLSLSSKEIGVTLPGALLLLELYAARVAGSGQTGLRAGVRREAAVWLLLVVVLAAYLTARFIVLGSIAGESVAPVFQVVGPVGRVLTAVALWFQYARLLLFPVDLVADYDPAVMFPAEAVDAGVILGATCLVALAVVAVRAWKPAPLVTVGILFFAVAVLPVSNLLFATGTVLAERTLYLPSVGLSLVAAGLAPLALGLRHPVRRAVLVCAGIAAAALFARTVARNPAWMSTFVVNQTLSNEHPESWRAFRSRAQGWARVGSTVEAAASWDQAVRLAPTNYTLLIEAGEFFRRVSQPTRAEEYFRQAIAVEPALTDAHQNLAAHLVREGRGRDAHRAALDGLMRAGNDRGLWNMVSESYVLRGDLPAAIRAREAALMAGRAPTSDWLRLAELLEAVGDSTRASGARMRAAAPEADDGAP